MSKIIGIVRTSFTPKDSDTPVEGMKVYTSEPIDPQRGEGVSTDSFFLSKKKLSELSFVPELNMVIEVLYNKFGKLVTVRLIDRELEID